MSIGRSRRRAANKANNANKANKKPVMRPKNVAICALRADLRAAAVTIDDWQSADWWEDPVHAAFVRAMNARAQVYLDQGHAGRARQLRHILRVQVGTYVGPAVRVEESRWAYTPCLQGTGELPGNARCIHVTQGLDDLVYPGGVCVPADEPDAAGLFCHAQPPFDTDEYTFE